MPNANQFQCPHCGQTYAATPEKRQQYSGRTIKCKKCDQPFVFPSVETSEQIELAASVPDAPLPPPVLMPPGAGSALPPPVYAAPDYPPPGGPTYAPPGTPAYAPPGVPAYAPPGTPAYAPPGMPMQYQNPQGYGGVQAANGMATAALVLGILGIVPLIGMLAALLAIIFGIVGLVRSGKPEVAGKGKGMAIAGIILGALWVLMLPAILLPALSRARETANRVKCGSNLRQIGQAMSLYANQYNGRFPDAVETLITDEPISPTAFVCPSSNDTPATGGSAQAIASNLTAGGHDSYVYLGKGKGLSVGANFVLAYEVPSNHRNQGSNFLFGDRHVAFIPAAPAQSIISQLQSGQNPPPSGIGY